MTSLYPGLLFPSAGLNKKFTPVRPEATPSEIDRKCRRVSFNGRPWPRNSPISAVYDICNTSTGMILLNNRLSKRPKGSRLRGQTDIQGDIMRSEPKRHTSRSVPTSHYHKQCASPVPERFTPVLAGRATSAQNQRKKGQHSSLKFYNGSGVNPDHHVQCQGEVDNYSSKRHRTQRRTSSRALHRESRILSAILNGFSLSQGERLYLNSIAKIYDMDDLWRQKQLQCTYLLWSGISKGCYSFRDLEQCSKFLKTTRKTKFRCSASAQHKNSCSAPISKSEKHQTNDGDKRPWTTCSGLSSVSESSRDLIGITCPHPREGRYASRAESGHQRKLVRKDNCQLSGLDSSVESLTSGMSKISITSSSGSRYKKDNKAKSVDEREGNIKSVNKREDKIRSINEKDNKTEVADEKEDKIRSVHGREQENIGEYWKNTELIDKKRKQKVEVAEEETIKEKNDEMVEGEINKEKNDNIYRDENLKVTREKTDDKKISIDKKNGRSEMYARESAESNKHGEITHDVNDRQRRNFERSKKGDATDGDDQKESIYGDSDDENSDRDKKRNVQEILGDDLEMSQHTLQTTAELQKGSVKGQKEELQKIISNEREQVE